MLQNCRILILARHSFAFHSQSMIFFPICLICCVLFLFYFLCSHLLILGLSEMFPESLRKGTTSLVKNSWSGTQSLYGFSRSAAWILFSTASILFMPVNIMRKKRTRQMKLKGLFIFHTFFWVNFPIAHITIF